ncbi:MAG: hypothetical protein ACW981_00290 [Candidatus Hodarchaeales archaeon]
MKKSKLFALTIFYALLGASFLTISAGIITTTNTEDVKDPNVLNAYNLEVLTEGIKENEFHEPLSTRFQITQDTPVYNYPNTSTSIELNASSYKPGETAMINITSDAVGLNGTLKWNLTSPNGISFFDFNNDLTRVAFEDPTFENDTVIFDWENDTLNGFSVINVEQSERLLRLNPRINISAAGNPESKLNYSPENALLEGFYEFSFNYYSTNDPDRLNIYFWNGTQYIGYELKSHGSLANIHTFPDSEDEKQIRIGAPVNDKPQIFFNMTKANTTYYLDNFNLKYSFPEIENVMVGSPEIQKGTLLQTYEYEDVEVQTNVSVSYQASWRGTVLDNFAYANFTVDLPKDLVYLGNWRFSLSYQPQELDIDNNQVNVGSRIDLHIPINITDTIQFNSNFKYVQRGYNDTLNAPIYQNETSFSNFYSPGDQIVQIGELFYETTMESFESLPYTNVNGYVLSNASESNIEDYTWTSSSNLQRFDKNGVTIKEGNFSQIDIPNPSKSWGVNYQIPIRGLYGNVTNTLFVTFPTSIEFDEFLTPNANIGAVYELDLGKFQVKFLTEIIDEVLPFDRVYYITEFLEGNFKVNTTHYNTSINDLYPNHNITTDLLIPREDLNFNVFFAKKVDNSSVLDFVVNLFEENFFFSKKIDPNLDIPNEYNLQILWADAYNVGDEDNSKMKFVELDSTIFPIKIRGTLRMSLPLEIIKVRQNENLEVSFNVTIEELSANANGLQIFGILSDSNGTLQTNSTIPTQEKDGEYSLFYTVKDDLSLGLYVIDLFTVNNEKLGDISFFVIAPEKEPDPQTSEIYVFLGAALVVLILVGYAAIAILKFK